MTHEQFAKTLQDWRKRSNYTQQEAADRLGVSRRSLENWEQKRAMPQGFGLSAMLQIIQEPNAKLKVESERRHTRRK